MTAQFIHPSSHKRPKGSRLLRLIGIFKLVKGILLIIAAFVALKLIHADITNEVEEWSKKLHIAPGERHVQELLEKMLSITSEKWKLLAAILLLYAAMFITEGIGLLLLKHWAEWMAVITTSLLIPFEVYEIHEKPTVLKALAMIVNVVVAVYLVYRVRREARERHADAPASQSTPS